MSNRNYTTDPYGHIAVPNLRAGFVAGYADRLPEILGEGKVREMALETAEDITHDARAAHGPVVWITSNRYMPAMRDIPDAERVWQADNNRDGELFAYFVSVVGEKLSENNVALECPDYDNALYAVDLNRWQYRDTDEPADDLNDEWEPRTVE